jgi:5-(carboxyamino)imidazole ribonucleotide synthase
LKIQDYHKTLGIAGAGQLGTMMILESRGLPVRFNVYSENFSDPAISISDKSYTIDNYKEFVDDSDIVTFEFEHINRELLEYAEKKGKLRPSIKSVELKMHRHLEKEFLKSKNFPVGEFIVAHGGIEALDVARTMGKFVIKRSEGGYDGKGQYYYYDMNGFPTESDDTFVVEKFVNYESEASIICARDEYNNFYFYEPSYNMNKNGILIWNSSPINNGEMRTELIEISRRLLNELDYIGVMGIEFFLTDEGPLINEYAPRVHNTGHHTLMGSSYSQFEMHVRCVLGLPLFQPTTYVPSGIVNIIGLSLNESQLKDILKLGNTRVYDYRKKETRKRRKMGHVCLTAKSSVELEEYIGKVMKIIYGDYPDLYI